VSAAIFFHPEAYTTSGPKLMGRNAAGESFLRGFLEHATFGEEDPIVVQLLQHSHAVDFEALAQKHGRSNQIHSVTTHNFQDLAKASTVYYPGPNLSEHAYKRRLLGDEKWSLCGITHTTSSAKAMDAIAEIITAPVQTWDALICTSTAVKSNVEVILQAQADELQSRLGATRLVLPKLPIIPLGIHTDDFEFTNQHREISRDELGVDNNTIVVLYTGRLSFHAKANPFAMYTALESAAKKTEKTLALVECGWHSNDYIREAFNEGAREFAPSIKVINLDGRVERNRKISWSGSDIFCSLSDNIQETFGIVPIEAMAAGMPVVVSDWDGYKDSVRDGVDGFRIPTLAPGPGLGGDLAFRHALEIDSYDLYCGHSSSLVAVDLDALTKAFVTLVNSPELRRTMGESGKRRAREYYDWETIIKTYESLWGELAELRKGSQSKDTVNKLPKPQKWPARLDPTTSFSNYPTRQLGLETKFCRTETDITKAIARYKKISKLKMFSYASLVFLSDQELNIVLSSASSEPKFASELISSISAKRKPYVLRSLAFLTKIGLLRSA